MNFQDLLKKQNQNQLVLGVVLFIYILFDVPVPEVVTPFINSLLGQVVLVLVAIMLLIYFNPILGVLGLFVAFLMIRKTSSTLISQTPVSTVTQDQKNSDMRKMNAERNKNKESLEESVINNMKPLVSNNNFSNASYKPVLDDNMGGSNL